MLHLFAFAMAAAVAGVDAAPLRPSGKWMVNYQENSCLLSRRFGPATAPVTLGFEPSMTAVAEGRLVVVVPDPDKRAAATGQARIALAPSGAVLTPDFSGGPIGAERAIVMWLGPDSVVSLTGATTITIAAGDEPPVELQTNGMTKALDAIRSCQDDLLKTWGVAPADMIRAEDQPSPTAWFDRDVYPDEAIKASAEGRVISLLTIGDDGKLVGCRIVVTSGNSDLDRTTCVVARRHARFGKVTRDPKLPPRWILLPVRWALPKR